MCRHRQVLLLLRFQQRPSGRVPQPGHIAPEENLGGLGTWPSPVCKGRHVGSRPRRPRAHNSLEGSPGPAASWGCQGGSRGSAALFLPRTAEAPSEDRQDDCYRLPIARDDIYFLASWEELARHEDTLLQVCAQPPRAAGTRGCSPQPQRAPATLACAAGPALATEAASLQHSPRCSNQPLCLQPGQVVGVDLEWRPSFGTGGRPRVSLMQVAVEGRVFLLDLPRLSSPVGGQGPHAFSRLVSRLLSDPSITKLGE